MASSMDIIQVLTEMNGGGTLAHINSKFRELNEAVKGTLGKGKLILTIDIAPGKTEMGGNLVTVVAEAEVKLKKPELALGECIFFIDDDCNLSRNDPRQEALFEIRKETKER